MPRTNKTHYILWHETCACKSRFDTRDCNDKQRIAIAINAKNWLRCECNWCKCRNRLIDKFVEKCDKDIYGNKMVYNATLNNYGRVCKSCTL